MARMWWWIVATLTACGTTSDGSKLSIEIALTGPRKDAIERVSRRVAAARQDVAFGDVVVMGPAPRLKVTVPVAGGAHCERFERARERVLAALTEPRRLTAHEVVDDPAFVRQALGRLGDGVRVNYADAFIDVAVAPGVDLAARVAALGTGDRRFVIEVQRVDSRGQAETRYHLWPIATRSELVEGDVVGARLVVDEFDNQPRIEVSLSDEGVRHFTSLTTRTTGRYLALMVDDEVLSVPRVMQPITATVVPLMVDVGGSFAPTAGDLEALATAIGDGPIADQVVVVKDDSRCVPARGGANP